MVLEYQGLILPERLGDVFTIMAIEDGTLECTRRDVLGKSASRRVTNILIATHSVGAGWAYWNSAYLTDKYNFVQRATVQG